MDFNNFSKESLYEVSIHDLRRLGNSVGVKAPSMLNKDQLIDSIYSIVTGECLPYIQKDKRGRPTKPAIDNSSISGGLINNFEFGGQGLGLGVGQVASQASPYIFGAVNSSNVLSGVFIDGGAYAKICKYPYVESADDAYISRELIDDYNLHPFDVVGYVLTPNVGVKEVDYVVEVNGRRIADEEVMFNRLERIALAKSRIPGLNVKLGGKYLIPCDVKPADTLNSAQVIDKIDKNKFNIIRLCVDKKQVEEIDGVTTFKSLVVDSPKVSINACSDALLSAKTSAAEGKNTVFVIDCLSPLISVFKENYADNASMFLKRVLFTADNFSNGGSITILCLVSEDKLETQDVCAYIDYFDKILK